MCLSVRVWWHTTAESAADDSLFSLKFKIIPGQILSAPFSPVKRTIDELLQEMNARIFKYFLSNVILLSIRFPHSVLFLYESRRGSPFHGPLSRDGSEGNYFLVRKQQRALSRTIFSFSSLLQNTSSNYLCFKPSHSTSVVPRLATLTPPAASFSHLLIYTRLPLLHPLHTDSSAPPPSTPPMSLPPPSLPLSLVRCRHDLG